MSRTLGSPRHSSKTLDSEAASVVHDHYVPDLAATMTLLQAKPLDTEAPSMVHNLYVRDLAGAEALLQETCIIWYYTNMVINSTVD